MSNQNKYIIVNGQLYNTDELYHYGVPGMKWGRRKAQQLGGGIRSLVARAEGKSFDRSAERQAKRRQKISMKGYLAKGTSEERKYKTYTDILGRTQYKKKSIGERLSESGTLANTRNKAKTLVDRAKNRNKTKTKI